MINIPGASFTEAPGDVSRPKCRRDIEMWLYAGRRALMTIPILLGVTIICFALVKIAPGDPVQNLLSPTASAEDAARLRAAYGLDKPIILQYVIWLGKVCVGNLGMSISDNVPVAGEVLQALVHTIVIALLKNGRDRSKMVRLNPTASRDRLHVRLCVSD